MLNPLAPTAMQALADVHDTPARLAPLSGLGEGWTAQIGLLAAKAVPATTTPRPRAALAPNRPGLRPPNRPFRKKTTRNTNLPVQALQSPNEQPA